MCAEGFSLVTKSVSVFVLVRYFQMDLLAYAASNLVYSLTLLTVYLWFTPKSEPLNLNKSEEESLGKESSEQVSEFTQSCVLKFMLQEGEKVVMIWQGHLTESADYSLVTALIGFICKYLF